MYAETVLRLLQMAPAGLTNDQLLWRLRRAGLRLSADEILQSLNSLSESGVAGVLPGGLWQLRQFSAPSTSKGEQRLSQTGQLGRPKEVLTAIGGRLLPSPPPSEPSVGDVDGEGPAADSDWRKLLSYYASTQRLDPRGAVDERTDRHGEAWQCFAVDGHWWERAEMRFSVDRLPPTFRQALSRREGQACAVGYPVCLFDGGDVTEVIPALLLHASFRLEGAELVVEIVSSEPVINPRWLKPVQKQIPGARNSPLDEILLREGDEATFGDVVGRLGHAAATLLRMPLRPGQPGRQLEVDGTGIFNVAALFLPTDTRFTQGAEHDLKAMQDWPDEKLDSTALGAILRAAAPPTTDRVPYAGPRVLTDRQRIAADAALAGPLTVIQGPPGTGKSEVILGLLSSIILAGGTALIVSKNHRALDEIEERLEKLVGRSALLTRARDSDGGRDTDLLEQLRELANGDARATPRGNPGAISEAQERANALQTEHDRQRRRTEIHVQLSELAENLTYHGKAIEAPHNRTVLIARIILAVRHWIKSLLRKSGNLPEMWQSRIDVLRNELAGLGEPRSAELIEAEELHVAEATADALRQLPAAILPLASERSEILNALQGIQFSGRNKAAQLNAAEARLVLAHRPIWAVSALSAATRIPMLPALFDCVIFDEASQCDIASALPLFGRAMKAVVVGDPKQLGFIPQISLHQERALMDAAGVPPHGRHKVAQSINSLFEFASSRQTAKRHFLADQFRSAPEIVAYLNAEFYEGRLVAAQHEANLRWPKGYKDYKPGLTWHSVKGNPSREDGGNVNHAEATAVVTLVSGMIRDGQFDGSIGVLSPFNTQVALIQRRINASLSATERNMVRVSTIDRFQGGEADVVLFSLVVGVGSHAGALTFYNRERRRLNVAISRARALCILVGDREYARNCSVKALSYLASERMPAKREGFDSEWERKLHGALSKRGLAPIPQYPVGSRSLDLAIDPEGAKLDVEVDGRRWHTDPDGNRKISDRLRDRELIARGWRVRRFWVHELAENMEKCVDIVERDLGRS